jgi:drug/metabolite transporter (DMT)-like permease
MTSSRLEPRALAALVALWLIWSLNWIVVKEGLVDAGPFVFGALRGVPGALVLFAVAILMRRPLAPVAPLALAALGLFQTCGFIVFTNLALVTGAVGKTTVLVYTFPFWTLLFAWPLLGERIRGLQWLAVAAAAAGLTLVIEPWHLEGGLAAKLFAVAGGMSWALAAMVAKWLRTKHEVGLLPLTAWQMLFGGLALIAVSLAIPEPAVQWTSAFMLVLGYTTLLSTAMAWLLWLYVLDRMPAGIAGLSMLAVPALAVLFSRIAYGERPGAAEVTGMVLIGASLALLSWLALRQHRAAAPELAQE